MRLFLSLKCLMTDKRCLLAINGDTLEWTHTTTMTGAILRRTEIWTELSHGCHCQNRTRRMKELVMEMGMKELVMETIELLWILFIAMVIVAAAIALYKDLTREKKRKEKQRSEQRTEATDKKAADR